MRTAGPGITSAMGVPSSSRRRSRARSTFPATVSSPSSGSEVKSLAHAADLPIDVTTLEVRPWGYQRQILDELDGERGVQGRHRNLVVMATGRSEEHTSELQSR